MAWKQKTIWELISVARWAAIRGYKPVEGYTFAEKNSLGQIEIHMILDPPNTNARPWWQIWRK